MTEPRAPLPPQETPAPPQEAARPVSYKRVVVMLLIGGPILAVGGCALFLSFLSIQGGSSSNDSLSAVGAITFIVGCVAFVVGILWALARWADRRSKKVAE
jgi:hypothetical protein